MAYARSSGICFGILIALAVAAVTALAAQAGWIADEKSGCRVWNPSPEPEDSIVWQGPCVDGFADGKGTLQWFSNGKHYETDVGEFRRGKLNGLATLTFTSGRRFEGHWVDQKPNGQGTLRTPNGEVFSGNWKNGCFRDGSRRAFQNATAEECGFK